MQLASLVHSGTLWHMGLHDLSALPIDQLEEYI